MELKLISAGIWSLVIVIALKDTNTSTFNLELILQEIKHEIACLRTAVRELKEGNKDE